jgi:ribosome-associated heat shock protein Hsp15
MRAGVTVSEGNVRLDKWLWAARFFKTRALAAGAVNAGKVHSGGQSVKPSRGVKIDDCFEVRRGYECFEIVVTELSERRGSATTAQLLYRETTSSIDKRKGEAEKRKLAMMARPQSEGRPDKKQRRQIRRFIEKP